MNDKQPLQTDPPGTPPVRSSSELPATDRGERALAEALLNEHYVSVYRLAYALLEEPNAARRAAVLTFALALARPRRSKAGDECVWLYSLAFKAISRVEGQAPPGRGAPATPPEPTQPLWQVADSFGGRERRLLVLYYVVGCQASQAAAVLRVSQAAVNAQLDIFRERFVEALGWTGGVQEESASLDAQAREILQQLWPAPVLSPEALAETAQQVCERATVEKAAIRRRNGMYAGLGLAGAALLMLVCLVASVYALVGRSRPAPTQLGGVGEMVTPFPPATTLPPLTQRASDAEIRRRLRESANLWYTLWIDTQITAYGPLSYIGPSKVYRARAWVSQPTESLEIFGNLSAEPSSIYLVSGGESLYINPVMELANAEKWDGAQSNLLHNAELRWMIYPVTSPWVAQGGWFDAVDRDSLAGRQALVVDWLNPLGMREARLWIDSLTGLILRHQIYGGGDFQTLLVDAVVTQIDLDRAAPPSGLLDILRAMAFESGLGAAGPTPVAQVLAPTPTLAVQATPHAALADVPAPPALDPAISPLKFQFPRGSAEQQSGVADVRIELFADDYLLGEALFGLPWALRCVRSPDGSRLAFNSGSDGTMEEDEVLRWLNLEDPLVVYQPLPGLRARYFAFSPDSRQLAAIALGAAQEPAGIYLVKIATGEYEQLLELQAARSLAWSPDGEYLALIAKEYDQENPALLVLHVRTRQVTVRVELASFEQSSSDWPAVNWGIDFPVEMGGMDDCAAP